MGRSLDEEGALELSILDLLPVRSPENAFADILGYKDRYRDELTRFRIAMHSIYQHVLTDPDIFRLALALCAEIEGTIHDLKASMKGFGIGPLEMSLKTDFGHTYAHHGGIVLCHLVITFQCQSASHWLEPRHSYRLNRRKFRKAF